MRATARRPIVGLGLASLAAAALLVGAVDESHAQVAMTVFPARLEYDLDPGASATKTVHVQNRGSRPVETTVLMWEWRLGATGEREVALPGKEPAPVFSWVTVRPETVPIAPGKTGSFQVMVVMPRDGAPAGYLQLGMHAAPTRAGGARSVGFASEIGVQVLVRSRLATPTVEARIVEVRPPTSHRKLGVVVRIRNPGQVHAWVEPTVDILGPFGDFVAALFPEEKDQRVLLFPGQQQVVNLEWAGSLSAAAYEAIATLYIDTGNRVATAHATFEVSPPREIVAPAAPALRASPPARPPPPAKRPRSKR